MNRFSASVFVFVLSTIRPIHVHIYLLTRTSHNLSNLLHPLLEFLSRMELRLLSACVDKHHQFNIQQLHALPTLIGFYNRDENCLLRGTNWVFK